MATTYELCCFSYLYAAGCGDPAPGPNDDLKIVNFTELKREITALMLLHWHETAYSDERIGIDQVGALLGLSPYKLAEDELKSQDVKKPPRNIWDLEVF